MKLTDVIYLLPFINNGWTLAAFMAVLVWLYAMRKHKQ
jgi:hypothetical protein